MLNTALHFSSASAEWSTPQLLFDSLNAEFGFTLDVCATPENAKCERFFTKEDDGLAQDWGQGAAWCNPPYKRGEIGKWVAQAFDSALRGATVVCLLPARTDTAWWDYVMRATEIRFVRGRLKFGGSNNSAPFPSAIAVFDRDWGRREVSRIDTLGRRWHDEHEEQGGRLCEGCSSG